VKNCIAAFHKIPVKNNKFFDNLWV
jgi:hypothetical protein